jgi:membrane dipeptidase
VRSEGKARTAERERLRALYFDDEARIDLELRGFDARRPPVARASLADVADHIEHVRRVAGVDHVGIGSDFDGITSVPQGLEDVSRFPHLIAELLDRGWSRGDVAKLCGANLLRVLRANEEQAARLQVSRPASDALIEELDAPPSSAAAAPPAQP